MAKWINSGNYNQAVKDTFAKMLAVFGIVFEEEVLDADIEALIEKNVKLRVPIKISQQQMPFVTN